MRSRRNAVLKLIETRWLAVGDFKVRRRGEIASREQANSELIETRKKWRLGLSMVNPFDFADDFCGKARAACGAHPFSYCFVYDRRSVRSPIPREARFTTCYRGVSKLFRGCGSRFPTYVTGILAWQFVLEGAKLKGLILLHFVAASCTAVLVVASWWMHWQARKSEPLHLPRYRIPIELLGVAVIAFTAHLGGFLSGVNR